MLVKTLLTWVIIISAALTVTGCDDGEWRRPGTGPLSPIRDWEPNFERPQIGCGEANQSALREEIASRSSDDPNRAVLQRQLDRCD